MKSIQIILLICIYIPDDFPSHYNTQTLNNNLEYLIEKGYIVKDTTSNTAYLKHDELTINGYKITEKGRTTVKLLYEII